MTRLFTCPFETGLLAAEDPSIATLTSGSYTLSESTDHPRGGAYGLKAAIASNSSYAFAQFNLTATLSRTYSRRFAIYLPSLPTSGSIMIAGFYDYTNGTGLNVQIDNSGVIYVVRQSNWAQFITGPTLATGRQYVIEIQYKPSTGATTLRVTDKTAGTTTDYTGTNSDSPAATGFGDWLGCQADGATAATIYFDDWALNDDQGTDQNSWCGPWISDVLWTTGDSSRSANMLAGGGGTSNLYLALQAPASGVGSGSATNTSQIKDSASSTTDNYQGILETYLAAGVPTGSTIKLVQPFMRVGNSTSTARSSGVQVLSNPVVGETTANTSGTAGTEPSGWTMRKGSAVYSPTVALGTAPIIEWRKNVASTNTVMCDLLGMIFEYIAPITDSQTGTISITGSGADAYSHGFTDSQAGDISLSGPREDAWSTADTRAGLVTASGSASETYGFIFTDSQAGLIGASGPSGEAYAATDATSGTVGASGAVLEQREYPDSQDATITLIGTHADGWTCGDTGAGTIIASGLASEQKILASTGAGMLMLYGAASDDYAQGGSEYTDSQPGSVTLAGPASEAASHADMGAGSVTASGSRSEQWMGAATGTATLSLSGSSSEQWTIARTAPGTITLTGAALDAWTASNTQTGTITTSGAGSGNRVYTDQQPATVTVSGTGSARVEGVIVGTAGDRVLLFASAVDSATLQGTAGDQVAVYAAGDSRAKVAGSGGDVLVTIGEGGSN